MATVKALACLIKTISRTQISSSSWERGTTSHEQKAEHQLYSLWEAIFLGEKNIVHI